MSELIIQNQEQFIETLKDPSKRNTAIDIIESVGSEEIGDLQSMSPILDASIKNMNNPESSELLENLTKIRSEASTLSTDKFNLSPGWFMAFIEKITGNTGISKYMGQYQSSRSVIEDVSKNLIQGKMSLKEDNILFIRELEKFQNNRNSLQTKIDLLLSVKGTLDAEVESMEEGEEKNFIKSTLIHNLYTQILDLQQVLNVMQQGEFGFNILIKGNRDLMKNVQRVMTVTVSAMSVGAMISLGLAKQKKVLDVTLSTTEETNKLLAHNANMLHTQATDISKQSNSAILNVQAIGDNMKTIMEAVDIIENSRLESLPEMNQAISDLKKISLTASKKLDGLDISEVIDVEIDETKVLEGK